MPCHFENQLIYKSKKKRTAKVINISSENKIFLLFQNQIILNLSEDLSKNHTKLTHTYLEFQELVSPASYASSDYVHNMFWREC